MSSALDLQIEEMLRKCKGSAELWEIVEQYGHAFHKKQMVAVLYQLGLCRQYERGTPHESIGLTHALVDRLVIFAPGMLTSDEASKVLWAMAVVEEINSHQNAHRFAMELGKEAVNRLHDFSPAQMANFVGSLSRLVKQADEDELVAKITAQFSEYAFGNGTFPRFPPQEIQIWAEFLTTISSPGSPQGMGFGGPGKGGCKGICGGGFPDGPSGQFNMGGMQPPWQGGGKGPGPGMGMSQMGCGGGGCFNNGGCKGGMQGGYGKGSGGGMGSFPPQNKGMMKGGCGGKGDGMIPPHYPGPSGCGGGGMAHHQNFNTQPPNLNKGGGCCGGGFGATKGPMGKGGGGPPNR